MYDMMRCKNVLRQKHQRTPRRTLLAEGLFFVHYIMCRAPLALLVEQKHGPITPLDDLHCCCAAEGGADDVSYREGGGGEPVLQLWDGG